MKITQVHYFKTNRCLKHPVQRLLQSSENQNSTKRKKQNRGILLVCNLKRRGAQDSGPLDEMLQFPYNFPLKCSPPTSDISFNLSSLPSDIFFLSLLLGFFFSFVCFFFFFFFGHEQPDLAAWQEALRHKCQLPSSTKYIF